MPPTSAPSLSRETLLPLMANHVLEHGLEGLSLRPLAKAAGTSDRMLIYHFGSKDALVEALLIYVADTYRAALDAMVPPEPAATRKGLAQQMLVLAREPMFAPFMKLWWEIVAGSAKGQTAWQRSAEAMMATQIGWLEAHMPQGDPDPAAGAQAVAAVLEGALMMDAIGLPHVGEAGLGVL